MTSGKFIITIYKYCCGLLCDLNDFRQFVTTETDDGNLRLPEHIVDYEPVNRINGNRLKMMLSNCVFHAPRHD